MKTYIAIFFRGNPQLKNGGYKVVKTIEARSITSAKKKARELADRVNYGTMQLIDVLEEIKEEDKHYYFDGMYLY